MSSRTEADLLATQTISITDRKPRSILTRKIWLPRLLYDCLPYFYLTAGFGAFFATLYINEWFWVLPHYVLFSAACLHLAISVLRKRRRNRPVDPPS
ncbi:MAG: hypothetical protein OEW35_03425 [Gammaproteobacteria bacterium]|nr:hypothetical protein [Gammaproteobacteria bacterium]MDH4255683.1 hypothetical protein [Gammaproteobacteria bacterium]MDH5308714.1 hypothetical protein [Gammaproteobacteria bacterium]